MTGHQWGFKKNKPGQFNTIDLTSSRAAPRLFRLCLVRRVTSERIGSDEFAFIAGYHRVRVGSSVTREALAGFNRGEGAQKVSENCQGVHARDRLDFDAVLRAGHKKVRENNGDGSYGWT